jgi:hypothetical protein
MLADSGSKYLKAEDHFVDTDVHEGILNGLIGIRTGISGGNGTSASIKTEK